MGHTKMMRALVAIVAISGTAAAYAQAPATPPAPPTRAADTKLVFDREVYSYGASARRDPFKALVGKESLGPLFEDLKLRGIIYSNDANMSLVLLTDGSKKLYRLHRGDVVGNARIVEVKPLSVRFAVENFGQIRYEVLELRAPGSGYASSGATRQTVAQGQTAEQGSAETAEKPALPPRVDFPNNDPARSRQLVDSIAKDAREKRVQQQKMEQKQPVSETPR